MQHTFWHVAFGVWLEHRGLSASGQGVTYRLAILLAYAHVAGPTLS